MDSGPSCAGILLAALAGTFMLPLVASGQAMAHPAPVPARTPPAAAEAKRPANPVWKAPLATRLAVIAEGGSFVIRQAGTPTPTQVRTAPVMLGDTVRIDRRALISTPAKDIPHGETR